MKVETNSERTERITRDLASRKVPGRTLPRGAQWIGHDLPHMGKAKARRIRQMERGQIPRICRSCDTNVVPKEREVRVCDECLAAKWDVDSKKPVDAVQNS